MKALYILLIMSLLMACGKKQESQPMPRKEDHELNPKMPKNLKGEMLQLQTAGGQAFAAYAVNLSADRPAILLVHEWWGLNDHIKATADKFADAGLGALALDVYNGKVATNPDQASQYMREANQHPEAIKQKLHAALQYLTTHSNGKIATIGWCFGGGWSLQASLQDPQWVTATIIYYGLLENRPEVLKKLQGPVLGIFANKDGWINPKMVNQFENALKAAGIPHQIYRYDADHAFANPSSARYNAKAASDAWEKTMAFLDKYLKS